MSHLVDLFNKSMIFVNISTKLKNSHFCSFFSHRAPRDVRIATACSNRFCQLQRQARRVHEDARGLLRRGLVSFACVKCAEVRFVCLIRRNRQNCPCKQRLRRQFDENREPRTQNPTSAHFTQAKETRSRLSKARSSSCNRRPCLCN